MTLYGGLLDHARFTRFGKSTQLIDKASKKPALPSKTKQPIWPHLSIFFFFKKKKQNIRFAGKQESLNYDSRNNGKTVKYIYQAEIDSSVRPV